MIAQANIQEQGTMRTELPKRYRKVETDNAAKIITALFAEADVAINGERPCDIRVNDPRFYRRVMADGTLGFGESYMEGWWDCDDLEELCFRAIQSGIENKIRPSLGAIVEMAFSILLNLQTKSRSRMLCHRHYDLGNDF